MGTHLPVIFPLFLSLFGKGSLLMDGKMAFRPEASFSVVDCTWTSHKPNDLKFNCYRFNLDLWSEIGRMAIPPKAKESVQI